MDNNFLNIVIRAFMQIFNWDIYARTWAFWLLLLIPVVFVVKYFKHQKDFQILKTNEVPEFNTNPLTKLVNWLDVIVFSITLFFLTFSLAMPQDDKSWEVSNTKGIDVVMALDVSSSMLARDFKPNRLEAAKRIGADFVLERNNDRFGLVIFAGESFTQCPITIDHKRLAELFDQVQIGLLEDGTAIGSGLATAVKRLKDSDAVSKVIVLLTDGENNSGDIAPETAARLAEKFGIKVYTIGIGTIGEAEMPVAIDMFGNFKYDKVPVKIDEKLLKKIAESTNGKYFRATGNSSLKEIYKEIDELEKTELESTKYYKKTELFLPFLLAGLLIQLIYRVLKITILKSL